MKKLRKRDKYVIAAVLNLCWYCIAVLVLTAHDAVIIAFYFGTQSQKTQDVIDSKGDSDVSQ